MSWLAEFQDVISEQAPLGEKTWLGVGGAAQYFAQPDSIDRLQSLVTKSRENDLPVRLLGSGSNLVIRDKQLPGVVIQLTAGQFQQIKVSGTEVTCGGGTPLPHLISETVGAGLSGLDALVGIPGTVGGALHGNAGSHGGDIGQWTQAATVLNRNGELIDRTRDELVFAYRESSLDELAIVQARFALEEDDPAVLAKRMQKQWIVTKAQQPMSHEKTICVFKDPRGMSAQMLIEQSGLKAAAVGGAEVSSRQANYIIAHPGATADDVLKLVEQLREQVADRMGVELENHFEVW